MRRKNEEESWFRENLLASSSQSAGFLDGREEETSFYIYLCLCMENPYIYNVCMRRKEYIFH